MAIRGIPSERTPLSLKNVNTKNIVSKNPLKTSPLKNRRNLVRSQGSYSERTKHIIQNRPEPSFHFHEETAEERARILSNQTSVYRSLVKNENDFNGIKENLDPLSSYCGQQNRKDARCSNRDPLTDLSTEEFGGFIQYTDSMKEIPLSLHWQDKITLPSYITPPRNPYLRNFFDSARTVKAVKLTDSKTTDDICQDKVVRKLSFRIYENSQG
ncbi:LAFE_0E00958g1_1 [Lachancea fermentati]|uniref:LAFE_0E00958g1_1 n=1 Tax=Lachancea fermentati TaxID=4955 RepID=A0A1G4MC96_LACFM|nr:LAFE_0E00958g1_1 [Lachancea fermentati]